MKKLSIILLLLSSISLYSNNNAESYEYYEDTREVRETRQPEGDIVVIEATSSYFLVMELDTGAVFMGRIDGITEKVKFTFLEFYVDVEEQLRGID